MKRIVLFLFTNIAVMVTLGIVTSVVFAFLGKPVESVVGTEWAYLAVFAFVYGLLGAFISLLISKPMAKMMTGAHVIDGSEGEAEAWLVQTVGDLARAADVKMPEVAVYPGSANAVANGDMVTLTLVQGVLNAFVIFFSRMIARVVASSGKDDNRSSRGTYFLVVMVLDLVLGILASLIVMAYSRKREYAADAGSARLLGSPFPMIGALERLGNLQPGVLPDSLKAMGIAEGKKRTSLWATHPSLFDRSAALRALTIH